MSKNVSEQREFVIDLYLHSDREIFLLLPPPPLKVVRTWRSRNCFATTPPTESGRLPEMTQNVPGGPPNKNHGYAVGSDH